MTLRINYVFYTINKGQFCKVLAFDKFKQFEELEFILKQEKQLSQVNNHLISIKRLDNQDHEDMSEYGSMEIYSEKANVLARRVWCN